MSFVIETTKQPSSVVYYHANDTSLGVELDSAYHCQINDPAFNENEIQKIAPGLRRSNAGCGRRPSGHVPRMPYRSASIESS